MTTQYHYSDLNCEYHLIVIINTPHPYRTLYFVSSDNQRASSRCGASSAAGWRRRWPRRRRRHCSLDETGLKQRQQQHHHRNHLMCRQLMPSHGLIDPMTSLPPYTVSEHESVSRMRDSSILNRQVHINPTEKIWNHENELIAHEKARQSRHLITRNFKYTRLVSRFGIKFECRTSM